MADTKITILGMSGSGKTCFLLGLYYLMGAGRGGYTLHADDDTDVRLRDQYAKLCDRTLPKEQRFPAGTDNVTRYSFDLQYGFKTILSFDWVDYPGGLLDRKYEGDLEAYEEVKRTIVESSSLFICVDGSLLVGDDMDEKIDNIRDNCSNVINTFFSEYFQTNQTLPPTAILVTKFDECEADNSNEDLCEIIQEAFSALFVDDENRKVVSIIPVSIGMNIMDDDYTGKMKPKNLQLPIFMGIWFALSKQIQEYEFHAKNRIDRINTEVQKLEHQKWEKERKWFRSSDEIKAIARKIDKVQASASTEQKRMEQICRIMESNSDRLLKELDRIPYVYLNGVEKSFSDILGGSK